MAPSGITVLAEPAKVRLTGVELVAAVGLMAVPLVRATVAWPMSRGLVPSALSSLTRMVVPVTVGWSRTRKDWLLKLADSKLKLPSLSEAHAPVQVLGLVVARVVPSALTVPVVVSRVPM